MRVRNITTCALGLAAALTLTSDLAAQDTTRLRRPSDQRISISKGEVVAPPRVDTVYVTRYDTVRVDNTIVRVDTVTVSVPTPVPIGHSWNDWYWGLFTGPTGPISDIDHVYTNGWHGGLVGGWEPRTSWFGFRATTSVNQIGKEQGLVFIDGDGDPFNNNEVAQGDDASLIYNLTGDLKVRGDIGGWAPYAVGGFQWNSFKRVAVVSDAFSDDNGLLVDNDRPCDFIIEGACFENANNDGWRNKWGYNFGVGTDFRIGSQEMFIEARWMTIRANGANSWYLPISLGIRYF